MTRSPTTSSCTARLRPWGEKIAHLRDAAGASSIMVHYPPWYGVEKALASLELFATEVAPKFRTDAPKRMRA